MAELSLITASLSQPYLTELDLRMALLPQGSIEYLVQAMPKASVDGTDDAFDYEAYLSKVSVLPL